MRRALILLVPLAACDSPSPLSPFAGLPAQRVAIEGSEFSVRATTSEAQAVRRDFDLNAAFDRTAIATRAGLAMERASGCRVVPGTLAGDAVIIEAELDC
jgi:hypothetical protein